MTPAASSTSQQSQNPSSIFTGVRAQLHPQEELRPWPSKSSESTDPRRVGFSLYGSGAHSTLGLLFTAATMPGLAPPDGQEQVRDTNYGAQGMA